MFVRACVRACHGTKHIAIKCRYDRWIMWGRAVWDLVARRRTRRNSTTERQPAFTETWEALRSNLMTIHMKGRTWRCVAGIMFCDASEKGSALSSSGKRVPNHVTQIYWPLKKEALRSFETYGTPLTQRHCTMCQQTLSSRRTAMYITIFASQHNDISSLGTAKISLCWAATNGNYITKLLTSECGILKV